MLSLLLQYKGPKNVYPKTSEKLLTHLAQGCVTTLRNKKKVQILHNWSKFTMSCTHESGLCLSPSPPAVSSDVPQFTFSAAEPCCVLMQSLSLDMALETLGSQSQLFSDQLLQAWHWAQQLAQLERILRSTIKSLSGPIGSRWDDSLPIRRLLFHH